MLAFASAAFAQEWEADVGKLREMERAKHWEEVLTATSAMLGTYVEDRQVEKLYEWRAQAYESTQRWDAIAAEAQALDKAPVNATKSVLAKVLAGYAGKLHRHQKGDLAIQVYCLVLERCPAESERCAWARIGIGDCLLYYVKDAQPRALPEFLAVERDYPKETPAVAAALQRIADYGGSMKDPRAAADACGRAVHGYRSSYEASAVERFSVRRGDYLVAAQDWAGAIQAYREAEESFANSDSSRSEMAHRQAVLTQEHVGADAAALPLERTMASYGVAAPNVCQDSLRRLVDIHLAARRYIEAAQFAHLGLDAGDRDWSLGKIVECLKSLDPTNARLEAFLAREIDGVKRSDGHDGADVLGGIGYPAWPAEIAKAFDGSLDELTDDWQSLRRKGWLCLYRGRPREGAVYLYRAFLACPNPQETVRLRVELLEDAYHGVYGTRVGAERWQRLICPGAQEPAPDADVVEMFKRDRPEADMSSEVSEAMATLGMCLARAYPVGVNPQDVARDREVLLRAYARIAEEKGREEDLIRFCLSALEKDHLTGLYDDFLQTALVMCRVRDGNAAGALRLLEDLSDPTKMPALAGRARGLVQNAMNQLRSLRNPVVVQAQTYRRYLPPPPRKPK